jgi:ribosomal protein S18 acetylase RimI-like enzyme
VRPERTLSLGPVIRRAAGADLADVTALWTALLRYHAELDPAFRLRPGTEGEIRRLVRAMLDDEDVAVFLGFGGHPQSPRSASGLCAMRVDRAPAILEEPRRAQITELYVREEARRTGLGSALARAALAHAQELAVRRLEVRVSTRNLEGQAFWRALGFRDFMDVLDLRL